MCPNKARSDHELWQANSEDITRQAKRDPEKQLVQGVKSNMKISSNVSIAEGLPECHGGVVDNCCVHHCSEEVTTQLESFMSTFPQQGF